MPEEHLSRAARLLAKDEFFLCVKWDEPYFLTVYGLIRAEENRKGTWTAADEANYQYWIARVKGGE